MVTKVIQGCYCAEEKDDGDNGDVRGVCVCVAEVR